MAVAARAAPALPPRPDLLILSLSKDEGRKGSVAARTDILQKK